LNPSLNIIRVFKSRLRWVEHWEDKILWIENLRGTYHLGDNAKIGGKYYKKFWEELIRLLSVHKSFI
jgi:hypothetical protein